MTTQLIAPERTIIGLMSGTSLDGISAALVKLKSNPISASLLRYHSRPYTSSERAELRSVVNLGSGASICRANFTLGELFAECALELMSLAGVTASDVDAIASHGQTIWHEPGHSTLQIGESAVIAERTGCAVISDFRVRDVAAGGQGAPLVPIADKLLFSSSSGWRALQNLGGIGNVTVVPPVGSSEPIVAFDTGPGMVVIDGLAALLSDGELHMDNNGELSRGGNVIHSVVDTMLRHSFFNQGPPKSTGRELFSPEYIANFATQCREVEPSASGSDIMATAVGFTAASVALAYKRCVTAPLSEVLLSGGGSRHPGVFTAIQNVLAPLPVYDFDAVYFDAEAKEAVAFALLGYLHLNAQGGNVPEATGAAGPRILGKYTPV